MEGCLTFQWGGGGGGGGEDCFSDGGGSIFKWGVHPMGRDISFDGGVFEKNRRMRGGPHAPHPCSEELQKCPPPSAAVQRFINVVPERKPR